MTSKPTKLWMSAVIVAMLAPFGVAHAQLGVLCPTTGCKIGGVPPRFPPPQYVSPPDVAFQLSPCVSSANAAFVGGVLRGGIVAAMQDLDTHHDDPPPNPEVRNACASGTTTFGVWLQPVGSYGSTDTGTARNVGLGRVKVLQTGETFAFDVSPAGFSRLVDIAWRDQARQVNDDGDPDPDGDFHLTDFGLAYDNAAAIFDYDTQRILQGPAVFLNVNGWYDGIQNTDFQVTIGDFLSLTQFGALQCKTFAGAHATETTIDTILASLVGGAGGSLGSVIDQGPGCRMASRLPRTVLVPGSSLKIVFNYTRVQSFASSGLIAAGTWNALERQPRIQISGPRAVSAEPNELFSARFTGQTTDLRPPFTVTWTSLNATPVSGQNLTAATMVWNLPTLAVGQQTTRNVVARVTDADGVTAQSVRPVTLKRVALGQGDPDDICQHKPSLPQCQP